jgi:Predicted soluble lytic transglycosylase fused to an ABC-type amino acid-binding protein
MSRVMSYASKYRFSDLEKQFGLPANTLVALMMQESRGNPNAIGPNTRYGRAKGAFQFIDATAQRYGVNQMDVGSSAKGAARYMSDLLKMHGGNLPMAFASYNWGEGNVQKYLAGKVKAMPKETRGYIEGTAKWRKAAGGGDYVATQTMAESQMDEYAKKIREQIALIGKKTEVEKQAALISIGKYGELTQAEKDSILNNAKLIDQENKSTTKRNATANWSSKSRKPKRLKAIRRIWR